MAGLVKAAGGLAPGWAGAGSFLLLAGLGAGCSVLGWLLLSVAGLGGALVSPDAIGALRSVERASAVTAAGLGSAEGGLTSPEASVALASGGAALGSAVTAVVLASGDGAGAAVLASAAAGAAFGSGATEGAAGLDSA